MASLGPQSLSVLSADCLASFSRLDAILQDFSDLHASRLRLRDLAQRFKAWASNIGALHDAQNKFSLDHRTREAPQLKRRFWELLEEIRNDLDEAFTLAEEIEGDQSLSRPESYSDLLQTVVVLLETLDESVGYLFKTSALARKATVRDRYALAMSRVGVDQVEPEEFDADKLGDLYPRLKLSAARWLQMKLARANNGRRRYLRYCQDHQKNIAPAPTSHAASEPGLLSNEPHDNLSAVASVIPESTATTVKEAHATHAEHDITDDALSDTTSTYSYTTHTRIVQAYKVTALEDINQDDEDFICPYCKQEIWCTTQKQWERHVFADIRAYACVHPDCDARLFRDSRAWMAHQLTAHLTQWACPLCRTSDTRFGDTDELSAHIRRTHAEFSVEEQFSQLCKLGERVPQTLEASSCPFCSWESFIRSNQGVDPDGGAIYVSAKRYRRHIGYHLEQAALIVLGPPEELEEPDLDIELNEESGPDTEANSVSRRSEEVDLDQGKYTPVNTLPEESQGLRNGQNGQSWDTRSGSPKSPSPLLEDDVNVHPDAQAGFFEVAEHWAEEVFNLQTLTEYGRQPGTQSQANTACFATSDLGIQTHLVQDRFKAVSRTLPFDSQILVQFFVRQEDHRARIVIRKDPAGENLWYSIPLTCLKLVRDGPFLQLCRVTRRDHHYTLWARLKFTHHEEMVVFYCAFVAMKSLDQREVAEPLLEDEFELASDDNAERLLFAGEIQHHHMLHALRLFSDAQSGVVRIEARPLHGPKRHVPIWTAFLTQHVRDPVYFRSQGGGIVTTEPDKPPPLAIFAQSYQPPRRLGGLELFFTTDQDAEDFVGIWTACTREQQRTVEPKTIPPAARWTKMDRRIVNPEALIAAQERFEEREDSLIVLRVLTREEIQKFADDTRKIRDQRSDAEKSSQSENRRTSDPIMTGNPLDDT